MTITLAAAALLAAAPVFAQDADGPPEDTVYDDTWLSVGVGVGYGPSYDGSDDYVAFPAPIVQGKVAGIGIQPRPAGLALDFVPSSGLSLGPVARVRANRARRSRTRWSPPRASSTLRSR